MVKTLVVMEIQDYQSIITMHEAKKGHCNDYTKQKISFSLKFEQAAKFLQMITELFQIYNFALLWTSF